MKSVAQLNKLKRLFLQKASHNGPHSGRNNGPDYKKKVSVVAKGRVTVYDGVLLKLRCPLSKDMKGSVSWMKGPEYLNILPSHMEFVQKTASLKIKNTTLSDSGVYTCNCTYIYISFCCFKLPQILHTTLIEQ